MRKRNIRKAAAALTALALCAGVLSGCGGAASSTASSAASSSAAASSEASGEDADDGSSPHTRGKPRRQPEGCVVAGIIPAHAGKAE